MTAQPCPPSRRPFIWSSLGGAFKEQISFRRDQGFGGSFCHPSPTSGNSLSLLIIFKRIHVHFSDVLVQKEWPEAASLCIFCIFSLF